MNAKELVIAIKSLFDSKGTEDARRQLAATGDAAGKASRNVASAGEAAGKSAANLRGAAGAAAALAGALGQGQSGVATVARVASGALAGLSAGVVGVAVALGTTAVAAWLSYRNKVVQALQDMETQHQAYEQGLKRSAELKLDSLVKQYKNLEEAADKARAATDRNVTALESLADAQRGRDLAKIAADEAVALNKVDPADEIATDRVKLEYAEKRAKIESEAEIEKASNAEHTAARNLAADEASLQKARKNAESIKEYNQNNPLYANVFKQADAEKDVAAAEERVKVSQINRLSAGAGFDAAKANVRRRGAELSGRASALDDKVTARDDAARAATETLAAAEAERSDMDMARARAEASAAEADSVARRERSESDQAALAFESAPRQLTHTRQRLAVAASRESDQASAAEAAAAQENEALRALISTMIEKQKANADMISQARALIANSRTSD